MTDANPTEGHPEGWQPDSGSPEWIGPYRVLEQIGRGGMGTVYAAEQREPVRRRVAIKVIRRGMESAEILARFEAERQALAVMDHPNIARVFDAGLDDTGRPYFAMEYVRGKELTKFCDDEKLDVRARLELFTAVCAGVAHAHQKGIIHRDLKPANVLVSFVDGRPVPKIIDFGVAKATDQRLTEQTLYTQIGAIVGTVDYMSPEQADSGGLDIDTRSDVYSLGVILYELLAGSRPLDANLLSGKGPREVLRVIREHTPHRPSTKVSTGGVESTDIASRRKVDERTLVRRLRGELDWIAMRALEKERDRRYQSVIELAADVRRYLSNEAVSAGPPSLTYRLRKVIQRRRGLFASAALVLLALCAGLIVSIDAWQEADRQAVLARRSEQDAIEERQRAVDALAEAESARRAAADSQRVAEGEARRANAVVALIDEMVGLADPHRTRSQDYTLRAMLERFGTDIGERLSDQPLVEATLRRTMGKAFLGLGLVDAAAPHLERALELRIEHLGDEAPPTLKSRLDMSDLLHARGDFATALVLTTEVLAILDRGAGPNGPEAELFGVALAKATDYLRHRGQVDEAQEFAERALAVAQLVDGTPSIAVAQRLSDLGFLCEMRGDPRGAERLYRESVEMLTEVVGEDDPATIAANGRLANILAARGQAEEAVPLLRRYLEVERESFGEGSAEVIPPMVTLGYALTGLGNGTEAEEVLRRACELVDAHGGEANINFASSRCQLGICLQRQRRWADSIVPFEAAFEFLRQRHEDGNSDLATVAMNLGNSYLGVSRFDDAVRVLDISLRGFERIGAPTGIVSSFASLVRAQLELDVSEVPPLLERHRDALKAAAPRPEVEWELPRLADRVLDGAFALRDEHPDASVAVATTLAEIVSPRSDLAWTAVVDWQLGLSLMASGDATEAEKVFLRGFAKVQDVPERESTKRSLATALADLCDAAGRAEEATRWRERADG